METETQYTKEYFIAKFEAIPEEEIGSGSLNSHCALWHCGNRRYVGTEESIALGLLFGGKVEIDDTTDKNSMSVDVAVYAVNDGVGVFENLGKTPKERILNKLKSL